MALLVLLNSLLLESVFAFTQFFRGGVKQVVGGTELVMATFIQIWKVEAAPIGTLQTFELERDDITGAWIIKAI